MSARIRLFLCEHFRGETLALLDSGEFPDVAPTFFASRCLLPRAGKTASVEPACASCGAGEPANFPRMGGTHEVVALGCACLPDRFPDGLAPHPPHLIRRDLCFELVADRAWLDPLLRAGAYLVTPGWLALWRDKISGWGADRAAVRDFCADSFARVALLDTGVDPAAAARLAEFGAWIDRPVERHPVGLAHFRLHLTGAVLRARLARLERADRPSASGAVPGIGAEAGRVSDYAMALDLLAGLSVQDKEERLAGSILELFTMLFAPEAVRYVGIVEGQPGPLLSHPAAGACEADRARLLQAAEGEPCTPTERGFLLRIGPARAPRAMIEVAGVRFLRQIPHYRNLAISMAGVLDMAIERTRAFEEILQARKAETISRLVGGIAHEYNNMLQVIVGQASLLEMAPAAPSAPGGVRAILETARRAARLTQELLAYGRRKELSIGVADLTRLLRDTARAFERTLPPRVTVAFHASPEPLLARVDPAEVSRMFVQLLGNAVDAMPGGGRIDLAAATHVSASGGRPYARIAVRDTGRGMDAETRARAFEPFFTTKPQGKGTGLGLASAQGLVLQFGGSIRLESSPGEGTAVIVDLPLVEAESVPVAAPPSARPGRGASILLAEDDPMVRNVLLATLESLGHRAIPACDGAEAVAIHGKRAGEIDLLLFDLAMPTLDGLGAYRAIRAARPEVRCILITGEDAGGVAERLGPDERPLLLGKPVSTGELALRIREALED